jgi:hypothetical protein
MMSIKPTPFLLAVQMNVLPDRQAVFQDVYDNEHVPALLGVPGVVSVRRFMRRDVLRLALGGSVAELRFPDEPVFTALYEIASPEVLVSEAWGRAVELGRWSTAVRPYTFNRRHTLHELLTPPLSK